MEIHVSGLNMEATRQAAADAVAEIRRRNAAAARRSPFSTMSDDPPLYLIVDEAHTALDDASVADALDKVARLGRKTRVYAALRDADVAQVRPIVHASANDPSGAVTVLS